MPANSAALGRVAARTGLERLWAELDAVWCIWQRDMTRFLRERERVFGALAQPLLFWLVIGTGIGATFEPKGAPAGFSYLAFMFPGVIALTLLFTSIFSTISVIADREHGFLREILASPVARGSVVAGKIAAGSALAVLEGLLLLVFAPFAGLRFGILGAAQLFLAMAAISSALTGLGLMIAWRMRSTQGFHMIMNFLMLPMWLLSGAVFPVAGAPVPMRVLMYLNPLTYGTAALRAVFAHSAPPGAAMGSFPYGTALAVTAAFAVLIVAGAMRVCRERR